MAVIRKKHDAAFKARVALEAVRGKGVQAAIFQECGPYPFPLLPVFHLVKGGKGLHGHSPVSDLRAAVHLKWCPVF